MSVFSDIIEAIEVGDLDNANQKLQILTGSPKVNADEIIKEVAKNFRITSNTNRTNTRKRKAIKKNSEKEGKSEVNSTNKRTSSHRR